MLQPGSQYRPMQRADLDSIMAVENVIYSHPWTRGNFSDSLNAGYSCWVFEEEAEIAGYSVVMLAADEAHLLNLSLYEKMGFNEMAIRRNYYPSHVGREDAIMMGVAL